jgi:hypothetical protein
MEKADALKIIQQLANGIDPHTGEVFRADSPYQHPDTVRALFCALQMFEEAAPRQRAVATAPAAPQNAGKPWAEEEDKMLAAAFDFGKQIPELATTHGRSRFAIEARFAKLGKIPPPPNMRGTRAESGRAAYRASPH